MNGRQRVDHVLNGRPVDRQPLFDILRNDAVIEHFAGESMTFENAPAVARRAHARALDGTRGLPKLPVPTHDSTLPDGRKVHHQRWTRWVEPKPIPDLDAYCADKRKSLEGPLLSDADRDAARTLFAAYAACQRTDYPEIAFFWNLIFHHKEQFGVQSPTLGGILLEDVYQEIGWEQFAFIVKQNEPLVVDLMEWKTQRTVKVIEELLPEEGKPYGVIIPDDLAFKTGPFLNPKFFKAHYYSRLRRIVEAAHARGIKVLFHSDGNLNLILDGLVETGIDFLNPIERLAGMDIKDIHRRYPNLVMAGGIDVSQLLARGTPAQIKDEVHRAIDDAGGRILVGSTTEIHQAVPLENFLAMRAAVGA